MKKLIPMLALATLISSCDNPLDLMKGMGETTEEMNKKMDDTNKNTSDLADVSEHGFTEEKRAQKWEELSEAEHMGEALTAAKVLMLAFEFQVKKLPATTYGNELREHYIGDALDEFYRMTSPIFEQMKEDGRLEKMNPQKLEGKKRKYDRVLYALATTAHFRDIIQEKYIKEMKSRGVKVKEISLYNIFKSALAKEANGERLSANEKKVVTGINKELTQELLQMRMTFLTALGVKLTVTKDEMSLSDKIAGAAFLVSGGGIGSLRVDSVFNEQNEATREQAITYFDAAVKTKRALEKAGVEPRLEKGMKSILENLEIPTDGDSISVQGAGGKVEDVLTDSKKLTELQEELLRANL